MRVDEAWARALAPVLVIAPHPDDESIGCGGLIALLRRSGAEVAVALVSDGAASHPGSTCCDAAARALIRRTEMLAALATLGVAPGALHVLGCADGDVPSVDAPGHDDAVRRLADIVRATQARTLVAPWRRDAHADHRAASEIARDAAAAVSTAPRLLEYAVWIAERGNAAERPQPGEARTWELDVSAVAEQKRRAVAAHRSQIDPSVFADPGGFTLPASMLERCASATETYYEVDCATADADRKPATTTA